MHTPPPEPSQVIEDVLIDTSEDVRDGKKNTDSNAFFYLLQTRSTLSFAMNDEWPPNGHVPDRFVGTYSRILSNDFLVILDPTKSLNSNNEC